jgi:hypothetical protein
MLYHCAEDPEFGKRVDGVREAAKHVSELRVSLQKLN